MKYMGSKRRLAKDLLPIMLAGREQEQWWVEPFVGGANTIDKVEGRRLGADINPYVIEALRTIRDHLEDLPKNNLEFTEKNYAALRASDSYKYKGYAGFAFSYGGKWLGGWRRDKLGDRDYVKEAYNNAVKQSPGLQGVLLTNKDYADLTIPPESLIYCDPPYKNTTKYKNHFNHGFFWNWCRIMVGFGHTLFVSEYEAPKDFECIWEKEIVSSLTKETGAKTGVERLFKYRG